ncbi:PLP-dependent aminotransferase family protein [Arcobacter sp. YIC-464]|uniref:aminotransferase-like domain-containing protein n=1 Tax=Arcobacter sp. YIC-464 TaxID=3376631 RepID=UPI003C1E045D
MSKKFKRSYIREILDVIDDDFISFAGGLPDETLFPKNDLKEATLEAISNNKSLQYSSSYGLKSLRKKIANFYNEKLDFPTSEDEILITSGSQQAFDIILKAFDKKVVVEEPSYIGALASFRVLNKKIDSFSKLSNLKDKIDNKSFLYLISDFQNPSTSSYNTTQRQAMSSIINKTDCFLIEDGAYTFLDFDNDFKTPISKNVKNSFHLGSFSKIIAPGLRVGWIRASKNLIEKLLFIKESLDLHTATLNQMILDEYLNKNDIFKHIEFINANYEEKMNYMADCLEKYLPSFEFERPRGGMFIYGKLECDSMELAKEALEKKLAIVPAEVFYLNKKSNEVRLNFTNSTNSEIEKGVKILSELAEELKISKKTVFLSIFESLKIS